jgi:hypothetical protein
MTMDGLTLLVVLVLGSTLALAGARAVLGAVLHLMTNTLVRPTRVGTGTPPLTRRAVDVPACVRDARGSTEALTSVEGRPFSWRVTLSHASAVDVTAAVQRTGCPFSAHRR